MTHKEKAAALFDEKFNCSQAVLGAFAEEYGLSEEQALHIALCFSAGMRKGEVCGAVSGAIMVLGLKYANEHNAFRTICPQMVESAVRILAEMTV